MRFRGANWWLTSTAVRCLLKLLRSGGTRRGTFNSGAFETRCAICRQTYGAYAVSDTFELVFQSGRARIVSSLTYGVGPSVNAVVVTRSP